MVVLAVQQLKDAFQLVDADKDGTISPDDLRHTLASLGIPPSQSMLDALLAARPGSATSTHPDAGINLAMFLTMMTDRLVQFDSVADLCDAFECFDETDTGIVKADELRRWMSDVGDRMDQHEIDAFLNGPFTDRHGNFNYREWINMFRVTDETDPSS